MAYHKKYSFIKKAAEIGLDTKVGYSNLLISQRGTYFTVKNNRTKWTWFDAFASLICSPLPRNGLSKQQNSLVSSGNSVIINTCI